MGLGNLEANLFGKWVPKRSQKQTCSAHGLQKATTHKYVQDMGLTKPSKTHTFRKGSEIKKHKYVQEVGPKKPPQTNMFRKWGQQQ